MTTCAEVELVTVHVTVSTEEVRVDEYLVFDYNEHGTGRVSDYNVFETTMGSVFDIAALKKIKDQPNIGALDNIGEIEIDLEYKVDEEAEAQFDIEALEEKGQPEIEAAENIVEVHVGNDYEEPCKLETEQVQTIEALELGRKGSTRN